eukprot:m.44240 g.44240  ORF g.44240 m.44240 type:complete len:148 (-) comp10073_c0_seq1:1678-2121(-)
MSKKKEKNPVNNEAMQRMNYLAQAAVMTNGNGALSRYFVDNMKKISKKLVLRIDPKLKRQFCKSCNAWLDPGSNAMFRVRGNHNPRLSITCKVCSKVKILPCRKNFETKVMKKIRENREKRDLGIQDTPQADKAEQTKKKNTSLLKK